MKKASPRPRRVIVLFLLSLVVLIFLSSGFRMFRFILHRVGNGFYYPYLEIRSHVRDKTVDSALLNLSHWELARQVEKLMEQNRELSIRGSIAAALLEENRDLRRKLHLPAFPQRRTVVAEISLHDPLRFRESFVVNKGSRDGISSGDAVVANTGDGRLLLVGIIGECTARSANVITLASPELRISGRIGGMDGPIGFTNCGNAPAKSDEIRFGMLPPRTDYTPGAGITTTGYESGIPEGIKIGELIYGGEILPALSGHNADVSTVMRPAVHFASLRFVIIISRMQENDMP